MEWQPIATAPKNRTEILAYRDGAGIFMARWIAPAEFLSSREIDMVDMTADDLEKADWFCADFIQGCRLDGNLAPTHWMPLPAPPSEF